MAVTDGDESPVVHVLDKWSTALSHGKVFTKIHREWERKPKVSKMACMSPHVEDFANFLQSSNLKLHSTFLLVRLKVEMVKVSDDSWTQRFGFMIKFGLKGLVASWPESVPMTADSWVRNTVFPKAGGQHSLVILISLSSGGCDLLSSVHDICDSRLPLFGGCASFM